jgi:hypothetical protein
MRIGELFVALGFKVNNTPLDDTEKRMEKAAVQAGKLALVVNAANLAMLAMVDSAMKAAVSLHIFDTTTGQSTDELQRWAQAAQVAGLDADKLKASVMELADTRNAFAFGEPKNVGAWQLLGVDPTQDPFVVIERLRDRMNAIRDPNIMRGLLGKVGMEGVMPLLQMNAAEFAKAREGLIFSKDDLSTLVTLNREWQQLRITAKSFANQLSTALAPGLAVIAQLLKGIVQRGADFAKWLNSSNKDAETLRLVLQLLAAGMLAVGAGLVIATAAFTAMMVLTSPLVATFGLIGGGIAVLILMLDDLFTAAEGGQHVFDWDDARLKVDLLKTGLQLVLDTINGIKLAFGELNKLIQNPKQFLEDINMIVGGDLRLKNAEIENRGSKWAIPSRPGGAGGSWTQENNVQVTVDGAQSPEATARAVGRTVGAELSNAAYQMPVPEY